MDKPITAAVKAKKPKAVKKAPAKKGADKLTAADQILKILKGRKKGTTAATLMESTGFDAKKIQNVFFRLFKHGKIKRVGKGIYVGA